MSASRTLRRKLKSDQDRRAASPPVKRGTPFKAQLHLDTSGGLETYLHATKGWRTKRLAA